MRSLLPFLSLARSLSLHFDVFCLLYALREPSVYWLPEIHPSFHQPPASIVSTKPVTWWFNRGFLGVISLLLPALSLSLSRYSCRLGSGAWRMGSEANSLTDNDEGQILKPYCLFFSSSPASVCVFHILLYIHLNSDINSPSPFRLISKPLENIFWLMWNAF